MSKLLLTQSEVMTDQTFAQQFASCTLPKEYLKHYGHLRICWWYLSRYSNPEAKQYIREGIMRFAKSLHAEQIYHETLTETWIQLVYQAMSINPALQPATCFAEFIQQNPQLLDKDLPLQYYSPEILYSELAREKYIPPDLKKLK